MTDDHEKKQHMLERRAQLVRDVAIAIADSFEDSEPGTYDGLADDLVDMILSRKMG